MIKKSQTSLILLALLSGLLVTGSAWAQSGDGYDLSWWTLDGGGGVVSGGGFSLSGTAGQPEAGAILTGGDYTLASAFWLNTGARTDAVEYGIYLPLVLR
jgi:hypothetical protein